MVAARGAGRGSREEGGRREGGSGDRRPGGEQAAGTYKRTEYSTIIAREEFSEALRGSNRVRENSWQERPDAVRRPRLRRSRVASRSPCLPVVAVRAPP